MRAENIGVFAEFVWFACRFPIAKSFRPEICRFCMILRYTTLYPAYFEPICVVLPEMLKCQLYSVWIDMFPCTKVHAPMLEFLLMSIKVVT